MDAKTGRDFSDLLSQQLDRSNPAEEAFSTTDGGPLPEPAPVAAQDLAPDAAPADTVGDDAPQAREDVCSDQGHGTEHDAAHAAGRADEPANAADRGESPSQDGRRSSVEDSESGSEEPVASEASGEPAAQDSGVQGQEELEEALEAVSQEIANGESNNPEARERIAALRELIAELQQAEPSQRRELAVTLGERIRALREEFSTAGGRGAEGEEVRAVVFGSDKAGHAGAGSAGPSLRGRSTRKGAEVSEAVPSSGDGGRSAASVRSAASRATGGVAGKAAPEGGATQDAATVREGGGLKYAKGDRTELSGVGQASGAPVQDGDGPKKAAGGKSETTAKSVGTAGAGHVGKQAGGDVASATGTSLGVEVGRNVGDASEAASHETPRHDAAGHDAASRSVERRASSQDAASGAGKVQAAELAGRGETVRDRGLSLDASAADAADPRPGAASSAAGSKGGEARQDARQGFFSRGDDKALPGKAAAVETGKSAAEGGAQGTGLNLHSTVQQRGQVPVTPRSAEVYKQVETGAFRNLGQGVKQLVIRLDPEDLGTVSVILQVKGKEVQAVLRASNQEASQALGEQLGQLRSQLEAQGLKVGKLEVQTQLADSQSQSQWQGAEQHNRYQENRELAFSAQRWRNLDRTDPGLVRDVQNGIQREKLSQSGLDIFA
jgi:flagellar hook-length control protein FliK